MPEALRNGRDDVRKAPDWFGARVAGNVSSGFRVHAFWGRAMTQVPNQRRPHMVIGRESASCAMANGSTSASGKTKAPKNLAETGK